jgi:hypothetical protein
MKFGDDEKSVYKDDVFEILQYTREEGGFGYEVIPIDDDGNRLNDEEICPEPSSLDEAKKLMEQHRERIAKIRGIPVWDINLRNYRGDALNHFRGTPGKILRDIKETLPWPQSEMWVKTISERMTRTRT